MIWDAGKLVVAIKPKQAANLRFKIYYIRHHA